MFKAKQLTLKILSFVLAIIICGGLGLSAFPLVASAEEKTYSNVLEDLKKDESFDESDYPADSSDTSLQVITISESKENELFVYVYQPSGDDLKLQATSINISVTGFQHQFQNYYLTYLNNDGVFFKYLVNDFVVSGGDTRIYEITSIYRAFNSSFGEKYDKEADADNSISEVPFVVAKQYTFTTDVLGNNSFRVDDIEYISIENKFVGYIRCKTVYPYLYYSGGSDGIDAHFVAFSTDRKIDELLEADVFFTCSDYDYQHNGIINTGKGWSSPVEKYSYINYEQKGFWTYTGLFVSNDYVWDRIQTTSEFLQRDAELGIFSFPGIQADSSEDINITETAADALSQTQWVLSFVETPYTDVYVGDTHIKKFSRVGDVSVLRLKFIFDGDTYDLGVIDNKQTGSNDPSGFLTVDAILTGMTEWWQKIMAILMLIVGCILIVLLISLVSPVATLFSFLWFLVKGAVKIIIFLLSLPFRGLIWLFKPK